ncbi:hypothetical protein A0256_22415 [Mucilaginibacter sp. PAMC 26640]|nr:hypothetical protein A0256_22415 [Mucilaginibacter sp. PAMC 26640]
MKSIKHLFSLLLIVWSLPSAAQTPKLAVAVPANLKGFIPKGYIALSLTKGNLNRDTYPDVAMVLYKKGEEKTSDVINHPEKRPLLLFLGRANETYKLAARSDNAVYYVDCGGQMGDPFTGVTIKNGYFSVEHYGGAAQRWSRIVTFKYAPADLGWFLHKDGHEYFDATNPDKVTSDIETVKNFGKVPFAKFNIYKEK